MPNKAKISINIDMENTSLNISIDGQAIQNVEGADVFTQRDSNGTIQFIAVSINTREVLESGVVKRVSFFVEGTSEANAAIASTNPIDTTTIPGFVGVEQDQVKSNLRKQIQSFYCKK